MPKEAKAEAAAKRKTRGTRRARSERGHQEGPQAACGSAAAMRSPTCSFENDRVCGRAVPSGVSISIVTKIDRVNRNLNLHLKNPM
jgi:hypothetical protein